MKEGFKKNLILNIIIIVLCIILFFMTLTFMAEVADYQRVYKMGEESLINCVRYQDYDSLVEYMYRNEARGEAVSGDMEKLYAVAHYYENAVLYQAYKKAGNQNEAQRKYEKMEEYKEWMGEYSFAEEDITQLLGITE